MIGFERAGDDWRALIIPDDSRVDFILQGVGRTKLEAAEDAKRRWEAGEQRGRTVVEIGRVIEVDEAMPVTVKGGAQAGGISPTVKVEVPAGGARAGGNPPTERIEVPPEVVERLSEYGWVIRFGDEPDGSVRGYLLDEETREVLKSEVGDDWHDALLNLAIDTYPPSSEGRSERSKDERDPRDS